MFGARFRDLEQPGERLPGGCCGWIKQQTGPRRCRVCAVFGLIVASGSSPFWDGAFVSFFSEKNAENVTIFQFSIFSSYLVTSYFLHNLFFPTVGLKKLKKADYAIYLFRSGVLRVFKLDDLHQNVLKRGFMCHLWVEVNFTAAEMPSMCL